MKKSKQIPVIYTERELELIGRLINKRSPAKQAVMALATSSSPEDVQCAVEKFSGWQHSIEAFKRLRRAKAAKLETVIKLSQAKTARDIMDLLAEGKSRQQSVMSELNGAMVRAYLS